MEGQTALALAEEVLSRGSAFLALGVEAVAVVVIVAGAVQAVVGLFKPPADASEHRFAGKKSVWLRFGMWLLLGLEFTLAADVIRTVIAPSWTEIGQLGAIAVIRTFLNYFLERDLEKGSEAEAS